MVTKNVITVTGTLLFPDQLDKNPEAGIPQNFTKVVFFAKTRNNRMQKNSISKSFKSKMMNKIKKGLYLL